MIENVQGHDFLVLNHNRTQLGFGPVDSSQAAATNGVSAAAANTAVARTALNTLMLYCFGSYLLLQ